MKPDKNQQKAKWELRTYLSSVFSFYLELAGNTAQPSFSFILVKTGIQACLCENRESMFEYYGFHASSAGQALLPHERQPWTTI
jgi:hypothetical protein